VSPDKSKIWPEAIHCEFRRRLNRQVMSALHLVLHLLDFALCPIDVYPDINHVSLRTANKISISIAEIPSASELRARMRC
jgi:hypothetical protein